MLFQVIIDKVLAHRTLSTLDVLFVAFVTVSVFEFFIGAGRTWLFSHTTSRVDVELGARLYRHLLGLPMAYFAARRVGDSVARVRELETIREFLTSSSVTVVIDGLFTVVFLVVMYIYSPVLLLVVVLSLPCYVATLWTLAPVLKRRLDEKFQRGSDNQSFLVESISNIETAKAMAVEPAFQQRWERQLAGYVRSSFQALQIANWGSEGVQLVSKLCSATLLFVGAKAVMSGEMTVGELVAFNMLAGRVSGPVLRLAQLAQSFQQVRIAVDRLGDILNTPTEPQFDPSRSTLPSIQGAIAFDGVTFRYAPGAPEVLRDVRLTIAPGEQLGIVGSSGSGKSTLTRLIQALHTPDGGRVLVDGIDLAQVDPRWLRRQIGVVLQENRLFNRTVRENIALSSPAIPMAAVERAARLAGAHEFILKLERGYDTMVAEGGLSLSGGQRQRIAIARALLTNPRILILDEATSALDAESEEIIQRNLAEIAQGRTVIIIAHRLSAVRSCDRIVAMEGGRIIEEGSHGELLSLGGRYAELHAKQMGLQPPVPRAANA
ncbi:type I secretion system permease/ATPase [Sphingomonas azotifigens]|uniref:type I secretion system permease/ATPase n=1 Tax=Sphingomonas azotifigens TaxID=330920 RepID=UPI002481FBA1|nr:type I secretion system permease/ATPase [Sphingomonas azotifigens]